MEEVYEKTPDWMYDMKGDGEAPVACKYYSACPFWRHDPGAYVRCCSIDCYGRGLYTAKTLKGMNKSRTKVISHFCCGPAMKVTAGVETPSGMFVDTRSIEMMAAGCCPPQLMMAILEGVL